MNKEVVIRVENISKLYRLGQVGTGTLSHDLKRWWALTRGKEDPYLKIGMENDRTKKSKSEYAWALKDINFEVNRGDTLGIIGKNGAGKSTLLKILSRVTNSSTGTVKIKGQIASLLEVGTGFHPELTGKENVYMNGAILGMTKKQITDRFDEIVAFSGIEKYIDTPVKRYSTGMTVRLGFAVAAHLDSEVLVVDEVLAVGDAEFQKKAIGEMKNISASGRTVLFVSHNMPSMKALCNKGILLKNGMVDYSGTIDDTIDKYLTSDSDMADSGIIPVDMPRLYGTGEGRFRQVTLTDSKGQVKNEFYYLSPINIEIDLEILKDIPDAVISIIVGTLDGERILFQDSFFEKLQAIPLKEGWFTVNTQINQSLLPGAYSLYLGLAHINGTTIDLIERVSDFHVLKMAYEANRQYKWDSSHGFILSKEPITIKRQ